MVRLPISTNDVRIRNASVRICDAPLSREKMAQAMVEWAKGDAGWKVPFQWENIGSMFAEDPESPTGPR